MDLFDYMREQKGDKESPLASRLRPTTIEEIVGQQHIIGKDKLLYRAIKADKLGSLIFYGPPGTGKTTLAKPPYRSSFAFFAEYAASGLWGFLYLRRNKAEWNSRRTSFPPE